LPRLILNLVIYFCFNCSCTGNSVVEIGNISNMVCSTMREGQTALGNLPAPVWYFQKLCKVSIHCS